MRHLRRLALKGAQAALLAMTFGFLIHSVGDIGWAEVWARRPGNPLFYAVFLAWYLLPCAVDTVVHSRLWQRPMWRHFAVFCIKKVYNSAVVGYLGEAYLYAWAKTRQGLAHRLLFSTIKDNGILSGAASNLLTVAVGAAVFLVPWTTDPLGGNPQSKDGIGLAVLMGAAVLIAVTVFGKVLLALKARDIGLLFAVHSGRQIATLMLQAAMWSLAAPAVDFSVWLLFLAFHLLLTRIPLLPNQDLMFMGAGVAASGLLTIPQTEVAAALLLTGALTQLAHAVVFGLNITGYLSTKTPLGPLGRLHREAEESRPMTEAG